MGGAGRGSIGLWCSLSTRKTGYPLARVDHLIAMGASGGGLFLNGEHVGNNWGRVTETNLATGVVREVDSLVVLNP